MEDNKKKWIEKINVNDALKIVGGGVFMASAIAISYGFGCKFTEFKIGYGIEQICKADPSLEQHLWDALKKAKELNK